MDEELELCNRITAHLFAAEVQQTIDALPGESEPREWEW